MSIKAIKNAELFTVFPLYFKDFGGFFILEPFGLLNFLKTILPPTNEEEKKEPPPKEEAPPSPPAEKEKQNAYLLFLEAHEKRAKRK